MRYPREEATNRGFKELQQHLYFDTMADFPELPGLDKAAPGSDAYCVGTGDVYILNSGGVWEVQ